MAFRFNTETKKTFYYESKDDAEAANGDKKMPVFETEDELLNSKLSVKDLTFIYNSESETQVSGFTNRLAAVKCVWAVLNKLEIPEDGIKQPKAPKVPKEASDKAAPQRGRYSGKKLFPVKDANPRRENSFGWRSMNIIYEEPGITTEDFIAKGGRIRDLHWDVERDQVRVEG